MGVNQRLFISRALNIYCLVTQDKTKQKKKDSAVHSYLIIGTSSLSWKVLQTTVVYYFMGLRPHSEISGLKFGLKKLAKSGT